MSLARVPTAPLKLTMEAKELFPGFICARRIMLLDEIRPVRLSERPNPLLLEGMISEQCGKMGLSCSEQ